MRGDDDRPVEREEREDRDAEQEEVRERAGGLEAPGQRHTRRLRLRVEVLEVATAAIAYVSADLILRTSRKLMSEISDDDQEQAPGDRRRVAELELRAAERLLVQVHRDRLVLACRAAHRPVLDRLEEVGLGEELEPADRRDDDREDDRRPDHRHGDVPELLPAPRAVDRGRLVQVVRDRLHRGEVEQRVVARPAPRDHHRERDPGREASGLPVDRADPDPAEQVVEQPVVAREQLREDQGDGDERGHLREQDAHPEERPPAEPGVESDGRGRARAGAGGRWRAPRSRACSRPRSRSTSRGGARCSCRARRSASSGRAGSGRSATSTPCSRAGTARRRRRRRRTSRRRGRARRPRRGGAACGGPHRPCALSAPARLPRSPSSPSVECVHPRRRRRRRGSSRRPARPGAARRWIPSRCS